MQFFFSIFFITFVTYARAMGSEDEAVDALEVTLDAVEQAGLLPLVPIVLPSLPATQLTTFRLGIEYTDTESVCEHPAILVSTITRTYVSYHFSLCLLYDFLDCLL